jgi:NAD(P)-dependent dehydrogenase (short-subunit alcohol dehydrogenase family)
LPSAVGARAKLKKSFEPYEIKAATLSGFKRMSPQVRTLVDRTVAAFGGLDYAFNNGGSGGKGRLTAEMDERDWDKTIDGYLKSVWHV